MRRTRGAVCALGLTAMLLMSGTAWSAEVPPAGVVTATPEKNSTGDVVTIDAAGNCFEVGGSGSTLIVVVKGPAGTELDHRELADTSNTQFPFTQTDQTGTYTATADCEFPVPALAASGSSATTATSAAVAAEAELSEAGFSYEPDTFEVIEPDVSATGLFTNDPDQLLSGTVVAGRPTFTG